MNRRLPFLLLILLSWAASATEPVKHGSVMLYKTEQPFKDMSEAVKLNIEGQGLVISYTSYPERMFKRTAKVLGDKPPVYKDAISYLFCKAGLTDDLVRKDPHLLPMCPYSISVYTLTREPDVTYISYILPGEEKDKYKSISKLLDEIIVSAIEF